MDSARAQKPCLLSFLALERRSANYCPLTRPLMQHHQDESLCHRHVPSVRAPCLPSAPLSVLCARLCQRASRRLVSPTLRRPLALFSPCHRKCPGAIWSQKTRPRLVSSTPRKCQVTPSDPGDKHTHICVVTDNEDGVGLSPKHDSLEPGRRG